MPPPFFVPTPKFSAPCTFMRGENFVNRQITQICETKLVQNYYLTFSYK